MNEKLEEAIREAKCIDYDKAVAVAGETIAQVIQGQHGGVIAKVGTKPLTIDALRQGSINSAVLASVQVCPNEVPAEIKAKVEAVLKGGSSAAPAAKPATPAVKPAATPAAKP